MDNPDDAWAWCGKGGSLLELNRHEEALEAFNKAIELKDRETNCRG